MDRPLEEQDLKEIEAFEELRKPGEKFTKRYTSPAENRRRAQYKADLNRRLKQAEREAS